MVTVLDRVIPFFFILMVPDALVPDPEWLSLTTDHEFILLRYALELLYAALQPSFMLNVAVSE